jgi:hypothetical protein
MSMELRRMKKIKLKMTWKIMTRMKSRMMKSRSSG